MAARWFGPFEVKKVLENNVYILVDQDGEDFPQPVNGNNLWLVSLRSLIRNNMWSAPPAILQKTRRAEARVAKELLTNTTCLAKLPLPRPRLKIVSDGGNQSSGLGAGSSPP